MREDLGLDAVFQRRDDGPAAGVVLRVRGEDELDVEGEAEAEAADLDIPLLQDVELEF